MPAKSYLNFDLLLNQIGDSYQVHVIDSPAGQASQTFTLPFSALELENFILKIGQNRGGVRSLHLETLDVPSVKKLGGTLYDCIFGGAVAERFRSSLALARHEGQGLRIRLRLSGAPALTDIPWELMFDEANNNYIGLSVNTPIIRQLDLATQPDTRQIAGVLQVLVMISSPSNYPQLDVEREWERINTATQSLQATGRLVLTRIKPSLAALQQQLRKGEYHVFHYIGHGGFDRSSNDGVLVLEDEQKKGHLVSGQYLGAILYDQATIQLALLNSCSGGRTSVTDPFAGVGQSLLQKGIPTVIAMQFEITDEAAITFSHEFYAALADSYPVDAAVAEARKMIYAKANQLEWATPVLYMSTDSGSILIEPQELKQASNFETTPTAKTAAPLPKPKTEKKARAIPTMTMKVAALVLMALAITVVSLLWRQNASVMPGMEKAEATPSTRQEQTSCLHHYLQAYPADRVGNVETGSRDQVIIQPQQTKMEPIALVLQENRKLLAAITFNIFPENQLFKINSIVDSDCQKIETFTNASRGGDRYTLPNWDALNISIGKQIYSLRLGYDSGKVSVDHFYKVEK